MTVNTGSQTTWIWITVISLAITCTNVYLFIKRDIATRNSLTCYNSAFEISYMSPPNAVVGSRPSQYGVWTLEDGTYVQNSGETCIVEKAQVEAAK